MQLHSSLTSRPSSRSTSMSHCHRIKIREHFIIVARAHQGSSVSLTSALEKNKPDWTGDDALSKIVNAAIGFKPLYSIMKIAAKHTMQSTAEKNGIPWRQRVKDLRNTPEVYQILEEIKDERLTYPSYYLKPFHAYDNGNLDWTAAFENESATMAMALRTWKDPSLTAEQAQEKLRGNIFKCLQEFQEEHNTQEVETVLDMGCSVGVSSRCFAHWFPAAQVTGLDLSPHFLAVAEHQERQEDVSHRKRIQYVHGLGECTSYADASFDVVNLGFVIHECPPHAIAGLVREAWRVLKPRGCLLISDNNPRSKTIQNLPPAIFTLMKSTEPWSDDYYQMDVEAALREAGFQNIVTKESDHRHRAVLGLKA